MAPVSRRRDLMLANAASVSVLIVVLLFGWRDAAAFGLAVLILLDLIVLLREWSQRRSARRVDLKTNGSETDDVPPARSSR